MSAPDRRTRRVAVPGTSTIDGQAVRGARLCMVTGVEELLVGDSLADASALVVGDELLQQCATHVVLDDGTDRAADDALDALSIGDREVLLLRLRQISFGDTVDLVVTCVDPACAAPMDIRLSLDDLCRDGLAVDRAEPGGSLPFALRLPTALDLHAVAGIALDDPERAERELARASVVGERRGPALDDATLERVSAVLAARDPHADIELALQCPACARSFIAPLDAAELLRDELAAHRRDLDVDIHLLAFHYHWSEAAILAMPSNRRRRYVDLLVDALRTPRYQE